MGSTTPKRPKIKTSIPIIENTPPPPPKRININPKQKALELVQSYGLVTMFSKDNNGYSLSKESSKKCALICIDEIIKSIKGYWCNNKVQWYLEVRKEIENL